MVYTTPPPPLPSNLSNLPSPIRNRLLLLGRKPLSNRQHTINNNRINPFSNLALFKLSANRTTPHKGNRETELTSTNSVRLFCTP